ncbi:MAG: acetyl ornithine aminotransferase family protein [Chloroflexi bacterium]|nr:acetyl ornithine aminotransferase family protein [Chloroflexota bacterium]
MQARHPHICTPLPGPRAAELVERDRRALSPSYTRSYPLVVDHAEGVWITDVDGNVFLDFTAGIAVDSTGHCHPRVVQAIQQQAARLIHMSGTDFYYPPEIDLAERLAALSPTGAPSRVFFGNSGTEAVEAAMKLARWATGRQNFVAFLGAFHGRTLGSLSLTGSKVRQRDGFFPLVPGVVHVPYAYPYRCAFGREGDGCAGACLHYLEHTVFQTILPPESVAAIVVEPVQGEGGYVVPPPSFLPGLRELADRHGILLIADEVQTGVGRTGKLFAVEHWNVRPDIVALAKGIASGMPLGATIARADLMAWPPGSHGNTFGGNPVSCAAALATLDLIEGGLMRNAAEVGSFMIERLREMQKRHSLIGDVRGLGLMIGVELVQDRETREPAAEAANRVVQRAFERGLLLLTAGRSVVRFSPPLVLTHEEAEVGLAIFEEALSDEAYGRRPSEVRPASRSDTSGPSIVS